jgi:hypothetical protein
MIPPCYCGVCSAVELAACQLARVSLLCFLLRLLLTKLPRTVCVTCCVLCWQVGDSISCFVMDVEDGTPLLSQRLAEDADEELAAFAGARLQELGLASWGGADGSVQCSFGNRSTADHVHRWCRACPLQFLQHSLSCR